MSSSTKLCCVSAGSHNSSAAHCSMQLHQHYPSYTKMFWESQKSHQHLPVCSTVCMCMQRKPQFAHSIDLLLCAYHFSSTVHKVLCYACIVQNTSNSCLCTLIPVLVHKLLVSPESTTLNMQHASRGACVPVRRYCTALRPVELG